MGGYTLVVVYICMCFLCAMVGGVGVSVRLTQSLEPTLAVALTQRVAKPERGASRIAEPVTGARLDARPTATLDADARCGFALI